jgi:hypothetical protein
MSRRQKDHLTATRRDVLDLVHVANRTGLLISILPNGALFAMDHTRAAILPKSTV